MLALCALAAAVLLGYFALSAPPPDAPHSAARQLIPDRSLPEPRQRVLDEITIEQAPGQGPGQSAVSPHIRFSLQRRREVPDPGFYLTPPGSRADDAQVESLLSALLSAVAERRLSSSALPADKNGGEPGPCRVRVRFGAGHTLCFGEESASGSVYVRRDAEPELLVVERSLFELLARPPVHYRAQHMVVAPLRSARRITLGALALWHDGDLWRVKGLEESGVRTESLADPALVDDLLKRLAAWPVRAWPTAPKIPPEAPPLILRVDGVELWRGGWPGPPDCPPSTQLFLRAAEPLCADDPVAQKLLPQASALRARALLPLGAEAVQRLQRAPRLDLRRKPDGTYQQSGQPAETASVRRILAQLTTLRTTTEAAPANPPAEAVHLEVTTTLGQRIALRLWSRDAAFFAQRDAEAPERLGDPAPELIALDELSVAPLRLFDLDRTAVRRITRHRKVGRALAIAEVVERNGGWQLRQPAVAPADGAAVAAMLDVLGDLRAQRWVSLGSRPEHGLDPPQLRIEVMTGGVASSANQQRGPATQEVAVELGAPVGEQGSCFARRPPEPRVALLPAASCAALMQPLLSPVLLRIDDDRLSELRLADRARSGAALSCAHAAGRWRCLGRELPVAAQRALLAALHDLARSESADYAPLPADPPRFTLEVHHRPLTAALLPPSTELAAVTQGEEVAPADQTLRLYPAPAAGLWARLDERAVTYRLPKAATEALENALTAAAAAPP